MNETQEARLKRLGMRSWRRGTKEMDLILGPFSDRHLPDLSEAELLLYDQLLDENDQDLYLWVTGVGQAPVPISALLERIAGFANTRL